MVEEPAPSGDPRAGSGLSFFLQPQENPPEPSDDRGLLLGPADDIMERVLS